MFESRNDPGIDIDEVPASPRTIGAVVTSITAFIGSTSRGPTDAPVAINSFADFERLFGGLWVGSSLGFTVRDFYPNGGGQAIIVRIYSPETGEDAKPAKATLSKDGLILEVVSAGAWGNQLRFRSTTNVPDATASHYGLPASEMFNLLLQDGDAAVIESFHDLTFKDSPRRVDRVLNEGSNLVRFVGIPTGDEAIPNHTDPAPGNTIWEDDDASTGVAASVQASDGFSLVQNDFTGPGKEDDQKGLYSLENADLFNILCIPPYKLNAGGLDVESSLLGQAAPSAH